MSYKIEGRTVTFGSLVGQNAFVVLGTIDKLLKKLERGAGLKVGALSSAYQTEATAGDYDNLLRVSHRYAYQHLASTLSVAADFDEYLADDDDEGDFG